MTGSKDLPPSTVSFAKVFWNNQFREKPVWPDKRAVSLAGKTAVVTGGNTGLGYEAALQLLGLGLARLILACRSPDRGEAAAQKMRALSPEATVEVWPLDMASYDSIRAFAARCEAHPARIDIALLNAGVFRMGYHAVPATGHEECLQVNYLSQALLAVLLLPIMKAKRRAHDEPARVTFAGAALALAAKFSKRGADPLLRALDEKAGHDAQDAYDSSKLLMHMFLWELVDRVDADDVVVDIADPAWCRGTSLARDGNAAVRGAAWLFGALTGREPRVGASCLVDGIVHHGKAAHGCFLMSWKIHPFASFLYTPEGRRVTERLWNETMDELEFVGARSILRSLKA
ncbi:uncharacterized protein E0L32_001725 [Thyridium curvatum]|uniref:Uncharacterized protein n=1 Tax=Thyridium curvatum TaxID=1093900 RepID=A0A507AH78_9PEZI|nr:uncharacterized protein E0L32_001474 [Thyridium curvatum]XP_030990976.1 uncharacterized protein E0L32_001725 [Thyridium curvatum]TPX09014.1 hypothetical protein E0L32_001474 [Thyridium curvatum]TPX09265.1 hypothetical protein E0L32_001725 [Thyridium curvatum]